MSPCLNFKTLVSHTDEEAMSLSVFHFNKLTSVFYASVLLLMLNFVITLSKCCRSKSRGRVDLQQTDNVMTKFIINKRTDA